MAKAFSRNSRSRRCGSAMRSALMPMPNRRSFVSRNFGSISHSRCLADAAAATERRTAVGATDPASDPEPIAPGGDK